LLLIVFLDGTPISPVKLVLSNGIAIQLKMEFSPNISTTVKKTPRTDLDKSARLLNEALSSTGKSLLRVSKNTPERRVVGSRRRG
jgi:hypothetical protein